MRPPETNTPFKGVPSKAGDSLADLDGLYFQGSTVELAMAVAALPRVYALSMKQLYAQVIADVRDGKAGTIHPELYRTYSENLRKGVSGVLGRDSYGDRYLAMQDQFEANVARFAAYKAFHATQQLERQLADRDGVARSPEEFDRMARAVLNTFNRYQAAEYNTAVARARTAKQWADFSQGDNMFLFPNIRWLPSRSATPREQHIPFYNRVWAKTDPFWNSNQPGNLWNCKCDWEETGDPVTGDNPEGIRPARGLEGNPSETGQIFTDECTYIKKAGKVTIDEEMKKQFPAMQKLLDVDSRKWKLDYYDDDGGFLSINRIRIKEGEQNKQEKEKFAKEYDMCRTLALNHHIVEYRESVEGSFDIFLDDKKADLKKTTGTSNICKYALKAIHHQEAELVVFEFDMINGSNVQREIIAIRKLGIHGYYFFTSDKSKLYPI